MNNNELLKELYDTIKKSGWLDKATEYMREHPEKFSNCCTSGNGMIANIHMSVSYQPMSLSAVADVKPNMFISTGNANNIMYEYNVYDNNIVQSRTWIDGEIATEDKSNV